MDEVSPMLSQQTSKGLPNATSSLELADGHTLSDLQVGQTLDPSGQVHPHASPSVSQVRGEDKERHPVGCASTDPSTVVR